MGPDDEIQQLRLQLAECGKALGELRAENQNLRAAVARSDERYHQLFTTMNEGFGLARVIYDEAGQPYDYVVLDINPSYERAIGHTREEMVGKTARQVYGNIELPGLSIYDRVARTGQPTAFEIFSPFSQRWWSVNAYNPGPDLVALVMTDITERRQEAARHEALLSESRRNEATYRAIAQSFPDAAIYVFDRDLRYQVVEGEALADFRQNREEMEGKTLWETMDPETQSLLEPRYRRTLAGESLHFETQYGEQHANRVIASDYRPIRDEAGQVVAGLLVARNITEERRAREEIRRANAELEATLSAIPSGLIVYDADGKIVRINDLAMDLLGYQPETWKLPVAERVGSRIEVCYPDGTPYARENYPALRALRGETARNEDMYVHLPESPQKDFWASISAGPIRKPDGQLAGAVINIRDTTALHTANEQLQTQANDLREAAERLDQRVRERTEELEHSREQTRAYARKLSDEVENERRSIARELHDEAGQSLTTMLIGIGMIEHEAVRTAAHLVEPIRELKTTTNEVMEGLHRLSRNLRPASLDRLGLVAALRQHIQSFGQQTGIEVGFVPVNFDNSHGRLPDVIETAVYRVVQEALTNVARHAQAQKVGVIVKLRARRVMAIVEDDGRGFDVDEAMQRGRLGLSGMRERAELLGGRFTIESSLGQGTTVFLDIPTPASSSDEADDGED